MGRHGKYPAEVRERAIRLVIEQRVEHGSEWETIESIAGKIGCTAEPREGLPSLRGVGCADVDDEGERTAVMQGREVQTMSI